MTYRTASCNSHFPQVFENNRLFVSFQMLQYSFMENSFGFTNITGITTCTCKFVNDIGQEVLANFVLESEETSDFDGSKGNFEFDV